MILVRRVFGGIRLTVKTRKVCPCRVTVKRILTKIRLTVWFDYFDNDFLHKRGGLNYLKRYSRVGV